MTSYGSKQLAASFRTVRENTLRIAEDIPEDHYDFRATPDTQSVEELLVHIALAPRFYEQVHFIEHRSTMEGFDFFAFRDRQNAEAKQPRSKAAIFDLVRSEGERFARALDGTTDEFLAELVEFPQGINPAKSRFEMLLSPKEHEMHHRGQLMLMERLLGITPHLTTQMQQRIAAMRAAQNPS